MDPAYTPKLVTLIEAAKQLSLSPWTLRRWARDGRIAIVKLSARVAISEEEIARIIAEGTRPRRVRGTWEAR